MKLPPGIRWTTKNQYVDEETGEAITTWNAKTNYIIITKDKHVTFNYNKTHGYIENTIRCRKRPQLQLFPNNE